MIGVYFRVQWYLLWKTIRWLWGRQDSFLYAPPPVMVSIRIKRGFWLPKFCMIGTTDGRFKVWLNEQERREGEATINEICQAYNERRIPRLHMYDHRGPCQGRPNEDRGSDCLWQHDTEHE